MRGGHDRAHDKPPHTLGLSRWTCTTWATLDSTSWSCLPPRPAPPLTVLLALQDGQAKVVGAQALGKERVPVEHHVLGGDGGRDVGGRGGHKLCSILRVAVGV